MESRKRSENGHNRNSRVNPTFAKPPHKNDSVTQHPSYNNVVNRNFERHVNRNPIIDDFETVRVPTPNEVKVQNEPRRPEQQPPVSRETYHPAQYDQRRK